MTAKILKADELLHKNEVFKKNIGDYFPCICFCWAALSP
ncbi:hypothetical protein BLL69_2769c [Lacticaseibacillus paracasei]|nr:hypothetical protein BLL69_2769c [Lacticaseibacillus paracasei]